jgi:hypothetical protein
MRKLMVQCQADVGALWIGSMALLALFAANQIAAQDKSNRSAHFGIHVVDEQTGRGVPLIELRTVNDIAHYSDSAGWVAFNEPGLMEREVYFAVSGPGYEYPKDGFGYRGLRLTTTPGATATIKVKRINVAERLYRITGQGIYRNSILLGQPAPTDVPAINAGVLGQDSVQAVLYKGQVFWLWGDTNLDNYPLGNFHTSAAISPLPGKEGFKPERGIPLSYFADADNPKRVRKMVPVKEPGAVWLFGLLAVPDNSGKETLLAHFSRHKDLGTVLEHGLVRFDDDAGIFKKIATLDPKNKWRFPQGNAFQARDADGDYFYFAAPLAATRVKASWDCLVDPDSYEALTFDTAKGSYRWQREQAPTRQSDEQKLLREGKMPAASARYQFVDAATGEQVLIHGASITWNAYRQRWLLIGVQQGGKASPSFLGEMWYAEAAELTGPWNKAVKIASHPRYSFYNPRHHAFLDEDKGRVIYFEGTYTQTFSGSGAPVPRYEYNQIMYRLDLADQRLAAAREPR